MSEERQHANSPSGAIRLDADETVLDISGDVSTRPIFTALSVVPGLAIAGYIILRAESLLSASAVLGYGFVAFSMWCLNSTKRKTVLRLTRDAAELTEALLFSTRHIRVPIKERPIAELDAIQWENWQEDMLRLSTQEGSNLYILKRHSVDDLRWAGAAIEQWFSGGPHNLALHLAALARRR
jgi:hypothetical protein